MAATVPHDVDALIVGAGPTGLTLAAELARHGLRVRVVDKSAGPVTRGQACVVYPRTLELLDAMGCADGWYKYGRPLHELSLHAFGHHVETVRLSDPSSSLRSGPLCISQDVTERMLVEHLGRFGVEVERLVEAGTIWQDAAGTCTSLRQPGGWTETVRAAWIIGCDGANGLVRSAINVPVEGEQRPGFGYIQADARLRWGHRSGISHAFLEQDRLVNFFPLGPDGLYRVLCVRPNQDPADQSDPTLDEVQAIVREVADPFAMLSDPLWLNRSRYQNQVAHRFREGRAFLAGDAAHMHAPTEGAGMNAGVQDAFDLAWKLAYVAKGWARPELLDTYDAERRAAAERLARLGDRGRQALGAPGGAMQAMMRRLGAAAGSGPVQQLLREVTEEVNTPSHDGLLWEDRGGTGVQSGARAPDAPMVLANGRVQCRLHEHLHGQRWTLLLFGGEVIGSGGRGNGSGALTAQVTAAFGQQVSIVRVVAGADAASRHGWPGVVLLDLDGAVHRRYGAAQEPLLVLVRPDLRIGFRSYAYAGIDALLAYLGRWLVPAAA